MNLPRYRFAHSRTKRDFTESEWIKESWNHFIRLKDDTDITFTLFLVSIFRQHIAARTIVSLDSDDRAPPNTYQHERGFVASSPMDDAHLVHFGMIDVGQGYQYNYRETAFFLDRKKAGENYSGFAWLRTRQLSERQSTYLGRWGLI